MRRISQSTAYNLTVLMVQSADHITGLTGATLTITASKAGAAYASITPTITELANGNYSLALTSAHTDTLGDLALHITAASGDPSDIYSQIVPAVPDVNIAKVNNIAVAHSGTTTDPWGPA